MAIVSIITKDNRRRTFAKQVFAHAKTVPSKLHEEAWAV